MGTSFWVLQRGYSMPEDDPGQLTSAERHSVSSQGFRRHRIENVELYEPLLAPGRGGGCRDFFHVGGDTDGLDAQALVRIESLLAIQTLHKVSGSFANRSSDAAGIDFYRPALGPNITVFIFQCDVVRFQSDLP